jgi:hypothetical protein
MDTTRVDTRTALREVELAGVAGRFPEGNHEPISTKVAVLRRSARPELAESTVAIRRGWKPP